MAREPDAPRYLQPHLRALPALHTPPTDGALAASGRDVAALRHIAINETPYAPSPKAIAAMQAELARSNRYPDTRCEALSAAIAARTGFPAGRIVFGTGSEEIMNAVVRLAVGPGARMVAPRPTFRGYDKIIAATGADAVRVANRPDGANDIAGLAAALDAATTLVVCVTPNNPTGAMLTADEIAGLVAAVPDDVLLFLDEAYHEFAIHAGGPDALAIVRARRGPWTLCRTFSKAYAMAGLRIGYCFCSDDAIANAMRWLTMTFNVPRLAQTAALAALEDEAHLNFILDSCARERTRMLDGMRALGLSPLPSVGNYVSTPTPLPAAQVVQAMLDKGVVIGAWGDAGFESHIRAAVGTAEDTDAFLAALGEVLRERA